MIPDFLAKSEADQRRIGPEGADRLLDAGRQWNLAPVLQAGGSLIFPHATIDACGHQIAAVVHACLDTGRNVVVLGVLHGLNAELKEARARAAAGEDVSADPTRGIQGPSVAGRDDWRREFSLSHFRFLWRREAARRGIDPPEPAEYYPFLARGHPETLLGIDKLRSVCEGALIIATMDAFHHGIGYGDTAEIARAPEVGGIELARTEIAGGFGILRSGDLAAFERHAARTRSDGGDVGQVLRLLLGPLDAEVLDLLADNMAPAYRQPDPTWVACALIALRPAPTAAGTRDARSAAAAAGAGGSVALPKLAAAASTTAVAARRSLSASGVRATTDPVQPQIRRPAGAKSANSRSQGEQ